MLRKVVEMVIMAMMTNQIEVDNGNDSSTLVMCGVIDKAPSPNPYVLA
jgi:hypothetical protein